MTTTLPAIATDADLLTDALRRGGVLDAARVRTVTADSPRDTLVSRIVRLRLTYDGDAAGAPASLFLKTMHPGRAANEWTGREVEFYRKVAVALPPRLVPQCFDTQWQPETKAWHLLLEDLADTHVQATIWPVAPSEAQCRSIVAALARFQAAWWDDPRLGVSVGAWVDAATGRQYLERFHAYYKGFADLLGERLSAERRALYERFLAAIPKLGERLRSRRNVTIVHGDAHVWNFFLPRDGLADGGDVRLFDWDTWRLGLATNDLAYMMATHWYPERRRRFERPLLDHYHATLLGHGVASYGRDALDDDYRLAVLMQLLTPIIQVAFDIPPFVWWSHLERIVLAVDDLGCRELLD